MERRIGRLGGTDMGGGKRLLSLPDDSWELVEFDVTDAEIASRFQLDEVIHYRVELPPLCSGQCLDGPLAGQTLDYVVNNLGAVAGRSTGGWSHLYEVVELAADGGLAELRHLESTPRKLRQHEGSGSRATESSADDSGRD